MLEGEYEIYNNCYGKEAFQVSQIEIDDLKY